MNRMQIVVLGVSVAAFGGAYILFNSGGPTPPAPIVQAAPKIETDEVLVAAQDVPMGTQIGDASVTWQVWPKAAISELMIAKSAARASWRTSSPPEFLSQLFRLSTELPAPEKQSSKTSFPGVHGPLGQTRASRSARRSH